MNGPTSPIHLFGGENVVRIIPGSASILQAAKLYKTVDIRADGHEYEWKRAELSPSLPKLELSSFIFKKARAHLEYVRKIIEDASEVNHFTRGLWLSAVEYLNVEGGIASNALGEVTVKLKDPSGVISGTIHHKVLAIYGKSITIGAVLILHNVSVFSPKPSAYYLNITLRNFVKVTCASGAHVKVGTSGRVSQPDWPTVICGA
ncbi:EEIG1/EHBP1 N-terminal domain-containing protein [Tanacetum coccineum]